MCMSAYTPDQMARAFMRTCGPTSFCKPDILPDDIFFPISPKYCTPCPRCFCDEFCHKLKDCCIDVQLNITNVHKPTYKFWKCLKSVPWENTLPKSNWKAGNIPVIGECPNDYPDNDVRRKCRYANKTEDFLSLVPVVSTSNSLSYRNRYCFECHNASGLHAWDMSIEDCSFTPPYNLISTFNEILETAEEFQCELTLKPNREIFHRQCGFRTPTIFPATTMYSPNLWWYCTNMNIHRFFDCHGQKFIANKTVGNCNDTGLWQNYDKSLVTGCESGKEIGMKWKGSFKNLHCLLCNTDSNLGDSCRTDEIPSDGGLVFNINHIFNISQVRNTTNSSCDVGGVFQEVSNTKEEPSNS